MKSPVAAIIGAGDMGRLHAKEWSAIDGGRVAAVYDCDQVRCKQLASEHNARACTTAQEAMLSEEVTVVSICTPVSLHCSLARAAMDLGKHVLVEKPIALSLEEAAAMKETAEKTGTVLGVSYQYRGLPKYRRIRELFREGTLGTPLFARFVDIREVRPKTAMHRTSLNGGPVIDMAGHFFDLMSFITDSKPALVSAVGHIFGRGKQRLEGIEDLAVDAAEIMVTYEGGHVLSLNVNWGMPEGFPVITNDLFTGPLGCTRTDGDSVVCIETGRETRFAAGPNLYSPRPRILDMVEAMKCKSAPEVGAPQGIQALKVCLGALESMRTGVPVALTDTRKRKHDVAQISLG